jgi:hypothetical protein
MKEPCKSCEHSKGEAGCALKTCYLEPVDVEYMLGQLRDGGPGDGRFYVSVLLKKFGELEKIEAGVQTCKEGHKYFADSHEYPCPRCESDDNRRKWRQYEDEYVLPTFEWAKTIGYDLHEAVKNNPGKNCVQLLFTHLRTELGKAQRAVKRLEEGP